jgi:hypothetical protein
MIGDAMSIDLDVQWPYVFTKFDGVQTIPELDAYIARMDGEVHRRREPYVGVTYLKKYSRDKEVVDRMRKWMAATEKVTRERCLGIGMVNSSTGFRFLLSAIFVIQPMPCPYEVCGTFDDALAFVTQQATKRGLKLAAPRRPWPDLP